MTVTKDDFNKIWASTSSVPEYTFSDADYKNGWEFVGNLPPTRAMWDALQRRNDEKSKYLKEFLKEPVKFLFPANKSTSNWDCELIVTDESVLMIDSGTDDEDIRSYLIDYMVAHGITQVDYFLLTHYHSDHDGNIIPFLNQSTVDFSHTKWYLPNVTLGFESHKTAIVNALQTADADYEILLDDKTVQIASDVTMEIWGANPTYIQFIDDNIANPTDLNPYSLYALIKHGNVNALYTGDGGYPATKGVMDFYNIPNIDLLKIQHHGMNTSFNREWDTLFFAKTHCKYATNNLTYRNFTNMSASATNPFGMDKRMYTQYAYANGSSILPTRFGAVEFVSDGNDIYLTSESRTTSTYYSKTNMYVYVDASYVGDKHDGSSVAPYIDINSAIDSLADRPNLTGVTISIAPGTYPALILTSFTGEILFTTTGTVNIGELFVSDCTDAYFYGTFTAKVFRVNKSNVSIQALTVAPDDSFQYANVNLQSLLPSYIHNADEYAPISIGNSMVYIRTFVVDGSGLTATYTYGQLGYIFSTYMCVRTLTIGGVTQPTNYIFQLHEGTVLMVDTASIDNSTKEAFRLQFSSRLQITSVTLGANFTSNLYRNNGGSFEVTSAPKSGTTAQRPDVKLVSDGYTYLDTTVGCLVVKIGVAWYKATDGTVVP